jgi:hypothetical protein
VKISDLVELSAQGQKQRCLGSMNGLKGIVLAEHANGSWKIHWFHGGTQNYWRPIINRRFLKHVDTCHRGGIGRHTGLKIRCSVEREGSSPSDGTKKT